MILPPKTLVDLGKKLNEYKKLNPLEKEKKEGAEKYICNKKRFETLEEAKTYAEKIFSRKSIIVGIELIGDNQNK